MTDVYKDLSIPIIARVEGEGALHLNIHNGEISQLELSIYEPPRLFEKFLEGRSANEVIDAVARICGICPVAYQMSAVQAIEHIFEMPVTPWVHEMRRLFYCGEWMESHGLHIHMLAAPDFLKYPSVIAMAKDHPEVVKRGMHLHGLGLKLMSLLGKRSVHPVGACVGGFYAAPKITEVQTVLAQFKQSLPLAEELVAWSASLPLAKVKQDFTSVSLRHAHEYPMNEGRIVSSRGLDIDISEFDQYLKESQVPYSTALQCHLQGKSYLVGPMARLNLNYDLLPKAVHDILAHCKINFPSQNMFHSVIARSVEIYYAMLEAIRIMENYVHTTTPCTPMTPRAGVGFGCTEAPRGLLWHRYEFNEEGLVTSSRIVPPTSQNQARIEEDLRHALTHYGLDHSDDDLRFHSEIVIRNYDPCISCSTHFLTLKVERA